MILSCAVDSPRPRISREKGRDRGGRGAPGAAWKCAAKWRDRPAPPTAPAGRRAAWLGGRGWPPQRGRSIPAAQTPEPFWGGVSNSSLSCPGTASRKSDRPHIAAEAALASDGGFGCPPATPSHPRRFPKSGRGFPWTRPGPPLPASEFLARRSHGPFPGAGGLYCLCSGCKSARTRGATWLAGRRRSPPHASNNFASRRPVGRASPGSQLAGRRGRPGGGTGPLARCAAPGSRAPPPLST